MRPPDESQAPLEAEHAGQRFKPQSTLVQSADANSAREELRRESEAPLATMEVEHARQHSESPSALAVLQRVCALIVCFGLARSTISITVLTASNALQLIHADPTFQTLAVGLSFLGQSLAPVPAARPARAPAL